MGLQKKITEKGKELGHAPVMYPYYVTSSINNLPTMKKRQKEKRTKLDPSGRKGKFMGYSKSSKDYRIYFPGFKKIDISRDVEFDEDSAYNKSKKRPAEKFEEIEAPRIHDTTMNKEYQEEDQEIEEPQEPVDPPQEENPHKRKPAWV